MKSINEIIKVNDELKMEIKILRRKIRELESEIKSNCNEVDLNEFSSLNYSQMKRLFNEIKFGLSVDIADKLKEIMEKTKEEENLEILDVHYFPILKNIKCIPNNLKKEIDNDLREVSYKNNLLLTNLLHSYKEKFNFYNELINEFIEKEIISPLYVFRCHLCSYEDDEDIIDYKTFKKMKDYWDKEKNNIKLTEDEKMACNYGFLEIAFECDSIEVENLEEFEDKISRIEYEMVVKPDLTLEKDVLL